MTEQLYEPAFGSLVIVEAGATVPSGIFPGGSCSDHAVVRQSDGESLRSVLRRAQRRIWDFVSSSVLLSSIRVVMRDAWTESDMLERELLGRSLLELDSATRARLTFKGSSNPEQPWAKLLSLVSSLVEGTDQADVSFALSPGVAAAPAIAAPLAASARAVPQVAA